MLSSTRTALKLAPGATDADAAAAIDKGGHSLTFRDLDKSDSAFLLYLKKQQPDTYARLYKAQFGNEPNTSKTGSRPAITQPVALASAKLDFVLDKMLPAMERLKNAGNTEGVELIKAEARQHLGLSSKTTGSASGRTLRELEKENPNEVLRLRRENPAEYSRLFEQQYGVPPTH